MLYILHQASDLFQNNVISFVPETTYLHWNTDFPAITICEAADNYKLLDYYDESCSSCGEIGDCPENFLALINKYRSPCNETLARCSWSGQEFDCCEKFNSMATEYGECFVFNSAHFGSKRMHMSNRLTGPGYLKFAAMETIKVEETKNEAMVYQVPARIRGCLFAHEEATIKMYPRYSYSVCIVQCRARRQLATCNCTHHMLPRIDNEPMCDINGLICLTKLIEEHIEADDFDADCGCLPSCDEPKYYTNLIKNSPNTGLLTDELIERGSIISIYMECLPSTRVRRLVVRSSLDYVVFVGGTAGVFFGASILSGLEVFYLLFIRKY
ncbi:sodium channel protein Nach-like [Arctopsyche grandis]|uniref:sodium channel protein Nach-like n=1 Tax=Arctopsyche grandis TaxID=121162 RepID=UPI00406D9ABD